MADPQDAEHNEYWPRGRTNHYWFDLNRDWLLAINPESRGKLDWYHSWYPNVVTDFHEMGSQSTYFFEPMKDNGSKDPIMPKENYIDLNNAFAEHFSEALDSIGSLYFTKEVFDGTYPGYGSSYPDLQGGLGILFEQASSRGHKQKNGLWRNHLSLYHKKPVHFKYNHLKGGTGSKGSLNTLSKFIFQICFEQCRQRRGKSLLF